MKKLLLLILIALVLALNAYTIVTGVEVGDITILGLQGIRDKSDVLQTKVDEATKLKTVDYPKKNDEIETSMKKLNQEKQTYEEMVSISSSEQVQSANQFEKYEIERLWVQLGNHATSEGVILKMDLVNGNANGAYNLNFTVNGEYVRITDFISDIENDSSLGFKIEEFKLTPGVSTENLNATFTCKNIQILDVAQGSSKVVDTNTTEGTEEDGEEDNEENTVKTTNTTKTNTNKTNTNKTNTTEEID